MSRLACREKLWRVIDGHVHDPLKIALAYAARGMAVFPVRAGAKEAAFRGYMDDATTDAAQIQSWFAGTQYNVGVQLAKSGLIVVDFDSQAAFDRYHALHDGAPTVKTPGGYHAYYLRGEARTTRAIRCLPDIDILSNGYVLAAGCVVDAKPYRTLSRGALRPATPEIVALVAKGGGSPPSPVSAGEGVRIGEGGRNQALFRLASTMRAQGLDADAIEAALLVTNAQRCVPPLEASEVATIATQAGKYAARDVAADVALTAILAPKSAPPATDAPTEKKSHRLYDKIAARAPVVETYATGITALDDLLVGGLPSHGVTIITGSPGSGKTSWALDIALRHEATTPILLVSAELDSRAIASRLVANRLGLVYTLLDRGKIERADGGSPAAPAPADQIGEMPEAMLAGDPHEVIRREIEHKKIWILEESDIPREIEELAKAIARMINEIENETGRKPILILDYLQILARMGDDLLRAVSMLMDALRRIGKFGYCVVALSATGRSHYGAAGKALRASQDPTDFLGSAKETGNIEFDATVVIHVDAMADGTAWTPVRFAVAKARGGKIGFAFARNHRASGRWKSDTEDCWQLEETGEVMKRVAKANAPSIDDAAMARGILGLETELTGQGWTVAQLAAKIGADSKRAKHLVDDWIRRGLLRVELEAPDGARHRVPIYRRQL